MAWKAYDLPPIDYCWRFLPTVEDVAAAFARNDAELAVGGDNFEPVMHSQFLRDFENAKSLASNKGWEGDFRSDAQPRVFFLPADNDFEYAFAWKQDNNGSTFVISPRELPWLD